MRHVVVSLIVGITALLLIFKLQKLERAALVFIATRTTQSSLGAQ